MRIFRTFLLVSLIASAPALAIASGVLLPDENDSDVSLPDLGLGGGKPGETEKAPVPPATPEPAVPKTPVSAAANANKGANSITTSIKPGGTVSKNALDETESSFSRLFSNKAPATALPPNPERDKFFSLFEKEREKFERPPTFINDVTPPNYPEEYLALLPYTFSVAVGTNYYWGPADVDSINRGLGYTAAQIPQQCQLRLDTTLATSSSVFMTQTFAGQQTSLKYDGRIQSVSLLPMAVCNPPQSMPKSGMIIRLAGGKYAIQLMSTINCPAPQAQAGVLNVTYSGDGKATCAYQ